MAVFQLSYTLSLSILWLDVVGLPLRRIAALSASSRPLPKTCENVAVQAFNPCDWPGFAIW